MIAKSQREIRAMPVNQMKHHPGDGRPADSRRERLNNLLANHIRFDSGMRYVFGYGRDGISTFGSANICAVVQTMFERVNGCARKTRSRKDQSA